MDRALLLAQIAVLLQTDFMRRHHNCVDPGLYEPFEEATVVGFIKSYHEKHAAIPDEIALRAMLDEAAAKSRIVAAKGQAIEDLIRAALDLDISGSRGIAWDRMIALAREAAFSRFVSECEELRETGEYELAQERWGAFHQVGLDAYDVGATLFGEEDVARRIAERAHEREHRVALRIGDLDRELKGGLGRQLCTVAGKSGLGKSSLLRNIALNHAVAGHKALLISMEEDETAMGNALEQTLFGLENAELAMVGEGVRKAMRLARTSKVGEVRIKDMPAKETTVAQVASYAEGLRLQFGFVPTLLLIDGADELVTAPRIDDEWKMGKVVARTLRNWALKHAAVVAAVQIKGAAYDKKKVLEGHDAGAGWKTASDVFLTINVSDAEKRMGKMLLYVDKARGGRNEGAILHLRRDKKTNLITWWEAT